jgi:hypothetical protein
MLNVCFQLVQMFLTQPPVHVRLCCKILQSHWTGTVHTGASDGFLQLPLQTANAPEPASLRTGQQSCFLFGGLPLKNCAPTPAILKTAFLDVIQPFPENTGRYLRFGHNIFLPHPFHFTFHRSPHYSTQYNMTVVEQTKNNNQHAARGISVRSGTVM